MKRKEVITEYGFFNLDKPSGLTSSTLVNKCKWLTGVPCGHMGTLDPLASGVLPVGVGNATRLFDYFLEKEKEYIAEFTFGETSDSLDNTMETIKGGFIPTEEEIRSVLSSLCGEVDQIPPKYSAKNVNGQRSYDLVRAGVSFELAPKKVRIDEITLLGKSKNPNAYDFRIRCGGGTYIRSIVRDMAEKLGTLGLMSGLRRVKSGYFTVENAIPFSYLEKDPSLDELKEWLIPTENVLPYPTLTLTGKDERRFFNGVAVETDKEDGLYKIYKDERFYGIAEVKNARAKAKTKLC